MIRAKEANSLSCRESEELVDTNVLFIQYVEQQLVSFAEQKHLKQTDRLETKHFG